MTASLNYLKQPAKPPDGEADRRIAERVSEMLLRIERGGSDAIRAYSRELDGWDPPEYRVSDDDLERARRIDADLRRHLDLARDRTRAFAERQRATLVDFEYESADGVVLGQRQVPVGSVGAYLPAGLKPLLASPFMTVVVPKVAGVERVVACAPPRDGRGIFPPMLYATAISGADAIYALGGVQALAAMAFGLVGLEPVDMVVGAGNAYVAEAKRQLYGRVGIDLLAGPSEILVIADGGADPELVAADLLGQAEHGPTSPATLVTTSEELGRRVIAEIAEQLRSLGTAGVAGAAWRDHGAVVLAADRDEAAAIADELAPEHLEVHAEDDGWFLGRLRSYGSLFLGERSTVAYSDKGMTGTNHVLPTRRAARYTGGLSVARFLKTLTYQRVTGEAGTRLLAPPVAAMSRVEELPAHEATATRRLARLAPDAQAPWGP